MKDNFQAGALDSIEKKLSIRLRVVCSLILVMVLSIGVLQIGLHIEVYGLPNGSRAQFFYDWGAGYSEDVSSRVAYEEGIASLKIKLGGSKLHAIRFDPVEELGDFVITEVKIRFIGIMLKRYSGAEFGGLMIPANFEMMVQGDVLSFTSTHTDPVAIMDPTFCSTIYRLLILTTGAVLFLTAVLCFNACYSCLGKPIGYSIWASVQKQFYWCRSKTAFVLAVGHFFLCFWFQHIAFIYTQANQRNMLICQFIFLIVLLFAWQAAFYGISQLQAGNRRAKLFFTYFGAYAGVMVVMLLLTWPGYFVIDEWVMIRDAANWQITSGYHFLMMLELILGMMLLPSTIGMELLQILLISAVVGYAMMQLSLRLSKPRWVWLCFVPLLFPGVLLNNLMLQRAILGGYIEIFLLTRMVCVLLERRRLTFWDALEWSILSAITFTLRMDGSYYIVLAPIIALILFRKYMTKRCLALFSGITIVMCTVFNGIQNDKASKDFYTALNFSRLGYTMIKQADPMKDADELEKIGRLINVEAYRAQDNVDAACSTIDFATTMMKDSGIIKGFRNAVIKLALKHPGQYLLQQLETFLMASGFKYFYGDRGTYLGSSASNNYQGCGDMFDPAYVSFYPYSRLDLLETIYLNPLNQPINQPLRKAVIHFCAGRSIADWDKTLVTGAIFGNLIFPVLALAVLWVLLLVRKQYCLAILLLLFLFRIPILFAAAPYASISYWVRFLVAGSSVPFWLAAIHLGTPFYPEKPLELSSGESI